MPKATIKSAKLNPINNCFINIPGFGQIIFDNLPEITDSKSVSYNDEPLIGRSQPLKTYSHSDNRVISMTLHFIATGQTDILSNLEKLRAIESASYPKYETTSGAPYEPPVVCIIKCGRLLDDNPLCVVLKNYSIKFPTDVAWDAETLLPYKFDVETTWETVFSSSALPGQENILL